MGLPVVTLVAGTVGSGKTSWICQQLGNKWDKYSSNNQKILYFSPGTQNVPIDQKRLAAEFPQIQVFQDGQEAEFLRQVESADIVYVELGFYLETNATEQLLKNLPCRKVAILPPDLKDSEWHSWANEIITGIAINTDIIPTQVWRVPIISQVIDESSLHEFWYEITHNAYGTVARAKGIFDVNDGRSIYGDYVAGIPSTNFLELDLPRHLEGKPKRFSGLEVIGISLNEDTLGQTLTDCCLADAVILQYQQQVKQVLLEGMTP